MPSYLHPGVYVEEIPSGSKPIEGVATSVAAFVGKAVRGTSGKAELIQSYADYTKLYGDIASEDDAMGFSVQSFYMNGGRSAYVCRLTGAGSAPAFSETKGEGAGGTPTTSNVLKVSASSEGDWGNKVFFRINKPYCDSLTFDLEIGHQEKNQFIADEFYKDLGMRPGDDNYALSVVNEKSALVQLGLAEAADPTDSTNEQYQAAVLKGGDLIASDTMFTGFTGDKTLTLNVNGLGAKMITLDPNDYLEPLGTTDFAHDAASIANAIKAAVGRLGLEAAYENFTCSFAADHFELTSPESSSNDDRPLASLEVYGGEFAKLLRIDPEQPAVLTGSGSGFTGGNPFSTLTGKMRLTLAIDACDPVEIEIDFDSLQLLGGNRDEGEALALEIQNDVRNTFPNISSYKDFECKYLYSGTVSERKFQLSSGNKSPRSSNLDVSGTLATTLQLDTGDLVKGRSLDQGTARVVPVHDLGPQGQGLQLDHGKANDPIPTDFINFFEQTLRKVRDVSIVLVPGESWADDGSGNAILSAALNHCEDTRSRMLLVDPPKDLELDQGATVERLALPSSTYSVLYYPWVKVANPKYNAEKNPTADKTVEVAPSGFAAGMWSRIDGRRGVWKAPAGLEAGMNGVSGLNYIIGDGEQDQLNPLGINCYRNMPGGGNVIWGSRTLATKADPEWRYVPVRRTAIMIEQSIYSGIQWAVFEPNDHRLWSALRANIGNFMNGLFRAGAFQGEKASDAYFVRCGKDDTMTQGDIDAGQVIVIVGFAPLKPAEFVIVRIQQKVNQQ